LPVPPALPRPYQATLKILPWMTAAVSQVAIRPHIIPYNISELLTVKPATFQLSFFVTQHYSERRFYRFYAPINFCCIQTQNSLQLSSM
jgi:hypothetical protein